MSKKKSTKKSTPKPSTGSPRKPTAGQLRGKLQRLDRTLVELFQERAHLVQQLNETSGVDALQACDASNVQKVLGDAIIALSVVVKKLGLLCGKIFQKKFHGDKNIQEK